MGEGAVHSWPREEGERTMEIDWEIQYKDRKEQKRKCSGGTEENIEYSRLAVQCIVYTNSVFGVDACFVKEYSVAVHAHLTPSRLLVERVQ
jgi:hypothetical protein